MSKPEFHFGIIHIYIACNNMYIYFILYIKYVFGVWEICPISISSSQSAGRGTVFNYAAFGIMPTHDCHYRFYCAVLINCWWWHSRWHTWIDENCLSDYSDPVMLIGYWKLSICVELISKTSHKNYINMCSKNINIHPCRRSQRAIG